MMLKCADFFCFAISTDLSGESFAIKLVRLILSLFPLLNRVLKNS